MKLIIASLTIVFLFLYVSGLTVTFKPFSVRLPDYILGLGVLFLFIGIVMMEQHYYEKGAKDTLNKIERKLDKIKTTE